MGLRSGDWLGHSRTLMSFFLIHSFVALAVCLGHCPAGIPIHDPFSMPWLASMPWPWQYMALFIVPLMRCSCRVPLAEKHPQSTMFPPPCLRWEWCPWGHRQHSSSSKHSELIWSQSARFRSHLTTTLSPSSPLNHLMYIGKLHSSLNMCFLEQGDLAGAAPFKRVLLISAPYLCKRHKGARNITDW